MDLALDIARLLALLSATALCIYLIITFISVKSTLRTVESILQDVSRRTAPLIDNLEVITMRVNTIAEVVEEQVDVVRSAVGSVKAMTDNIVSFEQLVQERVEGPVLKAASYARAVSKGVGVFMDRIRKEP